jgi:hypothetical protein
MPGLLYLLVRDPVPIAQEAGGPWGWSGSLWKISPPPPQSVFEPWTVQNVASRYINYAVLAALGRHSLANTVFLGPVCSDGGNTKNNYYKEHYLLKCYSVYFGINLPTFGRTYFLHLQVRIWALKAEAACSSETSVNFYTTMSHNIRENSILHSHCHDNLKSHNYHVHVSPQNHSMHLKMSHFIEMGKVIMLVLENLPKILWPSNKIDFHEPLLYTNKSPAVTGISGRI